ncbi:MAG: hypothetical protein Q9183_003554 [Haloplaca sp. 2 TL-2023]
MRRTGCSLNVGESIAGEDLNRLQTSLNEASARTADIGAQYEALKLVDKGPDHDNIQQRMTEKATLATRVREALLLKFGSVALVSTGIVHRNLEMVTGSGAEALTGPVAGLVENHATKVDFVLPSLQL